jgi:hypothetical protein
MVLAVDLFENCTEPPSLRMFAFPSLALLVKAISPIAPFLPAAAMRFYMVPELFAMPTLLMVSINPGLAVMCKDSWRPQ